MTDAGGHWITVTLAGGATRRDWVPELQPPPPGEEPGTWHIVRDELEAPSRWEWHPTTTAAEAPASAAKTISPRWSVTLAIAGGAMVLTYAGITVLGGGSDDPAEAVAADSATDQPLSSASDDRDDAADGDGGDDEGRTASSSATGSTASGAKVAATTPRPAPTTWAQEVAAAGPNDSIRLTPLPSDWSAESIVIGKDMAGKFLGRVTVRYAGPGTARGTFAVKLVKDGKEITTLTGELVEVRSGTYQVMLSTSASWVEGPWGTQFAVVSTS